MNLTKLLVAIQFFSMVATQEFSDSLVLIIKFPISVQLDPINNVPVILLSLQELFTHRDSKKILQKYTESTRLKSKCGTAVITVDSPGVKWVITR